MIENLIDSLEKGETPGILKDDAFGDLSKVVCEVLGYDTFRFMLENIGNAEELQKNIREILADTIGPGSAEFEYSVAQCIIRNLVSEDEKKIDLYQHWREYALKQMKQVKMC